MLQNLRKGLLFLFYNKNETNCFETKLARGFLENSSLIIVKIHQVCPCKFEVSTFDLKKVPVLCRIFGTQDWEFPHSLFILSIFWLQYPLTPLSLLKVNCKSFTS